MTILLGKIFFGVVILVAAFVAFKPVTVLRVLSYGRYQPGDVSPHALTALRWIAAVAALALAREFIVEILRNGI